MIELTFAVPVYREPLGLIVAAVRSIRRHYERARIVVVQDGDRREELIAVSAEVSLWYFADGRRLKTPDLGGAWVTRMLRAAVLSDPDLIIKMDPDSFMHRPFRSFPDAAYFGRLNPGPPPYVHGGCKAISPVWAEKLLASRALDSDLLRDRADLTYFKEGEALLSEDRLLAALALESKAGLTDWSEVNTQPAPCDDRKFAVTHGHR